MDKKLVNSVISNALEQLDEKVHKLGVGVILERQIDIVTKSGIRYKIPLAICHCMDGENLVHDEEKCINNYECDMLEGCSNHDAITLWFRKKQDDNTSALRKLYIEYADIAAIELDMDLI